MSAKRQEPSGEHDISQSKRQRPLLQLALTSSSSETDDIKARLVDDLPILKPFSSFDIERKIVLIEEEINQTSKNINDIERQIKVVENKIDQVEQQLNTPNLSEKEKDYYREEKKQLRNEKEQLRNEKELLRKKEGFLRNEKEQLLLSRPPPTPPLTLDELEQICLSIPPRSPTHPQQQPTSSSSLVQTIPFLGEENAAAQLWQSISNSFLALSLQSRKPSIFISGNMSGMGKTTFGRTALQRLKDHVQANPSASRLSQTCTNIEL